MAHGDRYLLVHGHFYQPPRENPWTGKIDPQRSAAPWENWNFRIADECYIPMARSRVFNAQGRIADLRNNYARTSFNFGPTLLSWLAECHPQVLVHLRDAVTADNGYAMAQAYSHMMLPLSDARDRHTQILWGLREFRHRFGFYPRGMWLPECGIDHETIRALIDHGVAFVILSPHQASRTRPFGDSDWRDVSMGAVDTRRAYRLFETDGGGRTHFDRFLDVVFYTPGLNLKVSFDHLLNRPGELARELENCYRPDYPGAQLVSIVTDGEIYGHHEKHGEEALSRLIGDIAPALGLKICSAWEFVRDHPPIWEIKLWNGEDGRGSSWSCEHGMGRWHRDCGCRPPTRDGWKQAWRQPFRDALNELRRWVRETARRELGPLLWDVDDARNDYIDLLLNPAPAARRAFLLRHAQRRLTIDEAEKLWRILEAMHNAMLMYTSCGWFFDELSGLEPVQNMRYALRAAELVQPWCDEDLISLLEERLAAAPSNVARFGDGRAVFRRLVLPCRHTNRELAGAIAVCLAAGLPHDNLSWNIVDSTETVRYADNERNDIAWGSFVCHDRRLDRFIKTSWVSRLTDFDNSGIAIHGYEEIQGDPYRETDDPPIRANPDFGWLREMESRVRKLSRQELIELSGEFGVNQDRLPETVRGMLYRKFSSDREVELLGEAAALGAKAVPFLDRARRHGAGAPDAIVKVVASAFEQEIAQAVYAAISEMRFESGEAAAARRPRDAAAGLALWPDRESAERSLLLTALEIVQWANRSGEPGWLDAMRPEILPDGCEWVAPRAPANRPLRHPGAGGPALPLGKGLAKLRNCLLAEEEPQPASLRLLPLPELLAYAGAIEIELQRFPSLAIGYWEFLDHALPRIISADPVGLMSGEPGDRVRRAGISLGFAEETIERRILAAVRPGLA